MSVLGLLLVREPETGRGQKTEKKQLDDSELPSLDAKEVLRTPLFYKVASSHRQLIKENQTFLDLVRLLLCLRNSGIIVNITKYTRHTIYHSKFILEPLGHLAKIFWFENDRF